MIYIFDIDGTLADISHRLHFIKKEPKDWKGFFEACSLDKPIPEVIAVMNALQAAKHTILVVTGRSSEIRDETYRWLNKHSALHHGLYMRNEGDHRTDDQILPERKPSASAVGIAKATPRIEIPQRQK